jgi:hypothetical protein
VQGRSHVTGNIVLTGSRLTTHYSPVLVADNDASAFVAAATVSFMAEEEKVWGDKETAAALAAAETAEAQEEEDAEALQQGEWQVVGSKRKAKHAAPKQAKGSKRKAPQQASKAAPEHAAPKHAAKYPKHAPKAKQQQQVRKCLAV